MRVFVFAIALWLFWLWPVDAFAMPPVIVAVGAYAGAAAAAAIGTATIGATIAGMMAQMVISMAFGMLAQAVGGSKGSNSGGGKSPLQPQDRRSTVRQPAVERDFVVGYQEKGGMISFVGNSGGAKGGKYSHIVVTFTGFSITAFTGFQMADELISLDMIDPDGNVGAGRYKNVLKIQWDTGSMDQPFPDLVAENIDWIDSDRQKGCAKVWYRFTWNRDRYPDGRPAIAAHIIGEAVLDDRDSVSRFTDNAGLVTLNYMRRSRLDGGIGAGPDSISSSDAIATANICDEIQDTAVTSETEMTVEAVDTALDSFDIAGHLLYAQNGDRVQVSTDDTLPGGLVALTDYYVIVLRHRENVERPNFGCDRRAPSMQLATNLANARARIAIALTDTGTGIHTITKTGEPKYCASGVVTMSPQVNPGSVLPSIMTAMGGSAVNTGGAWSLSAATFEPSTLDLTLDDVRGGIKVVTRKSMAQRFNTVIGQFVSPLNYNIPDDFPQYQSASALAEDQGEVKTSPIDRSWTTRAHACQRLSKIDMEHWKQEITVELKTSMIGLGVRPGSTVRLTIDHLGWVLKEFQVVSWKLLVEGKPAVLMCRMELQETAAAVYDWNSGEETAIDVAPNTLLAGGFDLPDAPQNLSLSSGNQDVLIKLDGTVEPRIYVTWDGAADDNVLDGGRAVVEYKKSSLSEWESHTRNSGAAVETYISGVQSGTEYDVRVKFVSLLGVSSSWVTISDHLVLGKDDPASDPVGFTAQQNGTLVKFAWIANTDTDLGGTDIKYDVLGSTSFEDANSLNKVTKGSQVTMAGVPPGSWTFFLSHRDTSGNASLTPATYDLVVVNSQDIIAIKQDAPRWTGTKTGLLEHVSGALVLDGTVLASAMSDEELWNMANAYPVASGSYEMSELDLSVDGRMRVWSNITSRLAPGETLGDADPAFEIDYRLESGAYDGFELWGSGDVDGRYVKPRIKVMAADGIPVVTGFEVTMDAEERVDTMQGLEVPVEGLSMVFDPPFRTMPAIQVTPSGGLFYVRTNESVNGFDLMLVNGSAVATAGTADITSTGL